MQFIAIKEDSFSPRRELNNKPSIAMTFISFYLTVEVLQEEKEG